MSSSDDHRLLEADRNDRIASALADRGWVELPCDINSSSLAISSYILSYAYNSDSTVDEVMEDLAIVDLSAQDEDADIFECSAPSSALQFFFDVFGFGTFLDSPTILISYVDTETGRQEYSSYSGDEPDDLQFFFEDIYARPAFMFQGTFAPLEKSDGAQVDVTWLRRQRTLNALCVDIDGGLFEDGKHPLEEEDVAAIVDFLPDGLTPSYINLTGNGAHFWYVFSSPIQTYSTRTVRRRKLNALANGLYGIFSTLFESYDNITIDMNCSSLNHAFRAPGSLTKNGNMVRCFCPEDKVFARSRLSAADFSRTVAGLFGSDFRDSDILTDEDAVYKTPEELREARERWLEERKTKPATEKQLETLRDLEERGFLKEEEVRSLCDISLHDAGLLLDKAFKRMDDPNKGGCAYDTSEWVVPPHRLISGRTGGVYRRIYDRIQDVPVGRRYQSMNMLAGVAYMMTRPAVPKAQLESDLMELLGTPWAKKGIPLNEHDVKSAIAGYRADNWKTVKSIVSTMGFSPFSQNVQPRNGRTRDDHLKVYLPQHRKEECMRRICQALEASPNATKAEVSKAAGVSPSTVQKYWDESRSRLGFGTGTKEEIRVREIFELIAADPDIKKTEIAKRTGLSRPTVAKYYATAYERYKNKFL